MQCHILTANANEDAATVTADLTLDNDEAGLDANGIPSGAAGKAFKVPATSKRILIIAIHLLNLSKRLLVRQIKNGLLERLMQQ